LLTVLHNSGNRCKTNSNGQQTSPDAAIDAELEALRKQVANAENKMQSNQQEFSNNPSCGLSKTSVSVQIRGTAI
jgi:hypothetical protein